MEEKKKRKISDLPENTNIKQYQNIIERNVFYDKYYNSYEKNIKNEEKKESPFLTVLIRTQGKREQGLRECFLCLQAQTDLDFEIILIGHKAEKQNKKIINNIIEQQAEEFRSKIRFVELETGTRTTPLNLGFSIANGKYLAIYDDDDILFDNWVESFHQISDEHYGKILHSYAFAQEWSDNIDKGYRAEAKPTNQYCCDFNLLKQMVSNHCPLMTLAFPVELFQKYGITFNEKLNVMEDWEYFMRTACICGVKDIKKPTALYRLWKNSENSASLHSEEEWKKAYKEIQKCLVQNGLIIPPENTDHILDLLTKEYDMEQYNDQYEKSTLFYSKGNGFYETQKISAPVERKGPYFNVWFPYKTNTKNINGLRFDLTEEGLFILKEICIELYYDDGRIVRVPLEECYYNAMDFYGYKLFLCEDPIIVWQMSEKEEGYLECVHISGEITKSIPRTNKRVLMFEKRNSIKRLISFIKFKKKGLL